MPISKNLARIISTISLFGMPIGTFGSCAYINTEERNLDKNSVTYVQDMETLNSAKSFVPISLFGIFLAGYVTGVTAYYRREDEEKEIFEKMYENYNSYNSSQRESFRDEALKSWGEEGLEIFLERAEKWKNRNF